MCTFRGTPGWISAPRRPCVQTLVCSITMLKWWDTWERWCFLCKLSGMNIVLWKHKMTNTKKRRTSDTYNKPHVPSTFLDLVQCWVTLNWIISILRVTFCWSPAILSSYTRGQGRRRLNNCPTSYCGQATVQCGCFLPTHSVLWQVSQKKGPEDVGDFNLTWSSEGRWL